MIVDNCSVAGISGNGGEAFTYEQLLLRTEFTQFLLYRHLRYNTFCHRLLEPHEKLHQGYPILDHGVAETVEFGPVLDSLHQIYW